MVKIGEEIKQTKFKSPYQKAVINLIFTTNWLQHQQQQFFKAAGITTQQFNILRILRGQYPNKLSATEIKSRMLDRNSDVSRLLDRLEVKKLVCKQACPKDKRAADVSITEDGIRLLEQIETQQDRVDNILQLTEAEAEQLSNLLDKARG